jgi:hypothetical protein
VKQPIMQPTITRNHIHIFNYFIHYFEILIKPSKNAPWPESASDLPTSDRHLSVKLVPISVDRGCYVISVTDP